MHAFAAGDIVVRVRQWYKRFGFIGLPPSPKRSERRDSGARGFCLGLRPRIGST
jgi:hypothetical protein